MISSDDLKAMGYVPNPETGVIERAKKHGGLVIGFDPSLQNMGFAVVDLDAKLARTQHFRLPPRLAEDYSVTFGKEYALLEMRLRQIGERVVESIYAAEREAAIMTHPVVLVEGAYFSGRGKIDPMSIIKYGMAVGATFARATEMAAEAYLVPPDWTWRVLMGSAKGGATKRERWIRAQVVLACEDIHWPLSEPDEIKDRTKDEHQADALALCAAWIHRINQGGRT